jgi:hypothetical protein
VGLRPAQKKKTKNRAPALFWLRIHTPSEQAAGSEGSRLMSFAQISMAFSRGVDVARPAAR